MFADKGEFTIRFWGVRGSYPTPGGETAGYGGNTACVEIEANGRTIILDAGTGIIPLGRSLDRRARERGTKVEAVLLFSHLHHDHTQGFPFFVPGYIPNARLSIYGPNILGSNPQDALEQVMQPPYFPIRLADLRANLSFEVLREADHLVIGAPGEENQVCPSNAAEDANLLRVRVLRSYAHPGDVYHYRIEWQGRSVVYATDTEGYVNGDRRLEAFARGADVLIHDAQYTDEHYLGLAPGLSVTQGFGHSTASMACQTALASEAKQLVLFHHAPEYDDAQLDRIGMRAQEIFPYSLVAREGLEIQLVNSPMERLPVTRVPSEKCAE
jgi:phosphoribosyl 1,2-cyclic phosphodiesterase